MACAIGGYFTLALSNDGSLYSFGANVYGQLGLGHCEIVTSPTFIPNLPKITMVSCGAEFTVCIDEQGFLWSFGGNDYGQLGTGNTMFAKVPQKIEPFDDTNEIHRAKNISCGGNHILVLSNDDNLWTCGSNSFGQLCIGDRTLKKTNFQKTSFSNISKISAGYHYSLFQNFDGELYGCGSNANGELGLGHMKSPQIFPCIIPHQIPNIAHFCSGSYHSLCLDIEGNVFYTGTTIFTSYYDPSDHKIPQNKFHQILNLPPIRAISCVGPSSYLIDFEDNLWSFGGNESGQLGHGDYISRNDPKLMQITNVSKLSHGASGYHFLAKDLEDTIFSVGKNVQGALGFPNCGNKICIPKPIDPEFFSIWGDSDYQFTLRYNAKSARK